MRGLKLTGWAPSGPGHPAVRGVGPIAVEAGHTPLDAVGHSDHAGVLADRIVDRMLEAVRHEGEGGAEAARYRVRRPRPVRDLSHLVEGHDGEARRPELALLLGKARAELIERTRPVAGWHDAVIARPGEVEVQLQRVG